MIRLRMIAEGAPEVVVRQVSEQAKAARALHPEWGPIVSAARDAVVLQAQQQPADTVMVVSVAVECQVSTRAAEVEAAPAPVEIPQEAKQVVGHTDGFARTRKVN